MGTPAVVNQGSCGSCWAFGAASSLESEIYFQSGFNGKGVQKLSEKQYLDCALDGENGCNGGWMASCYTYNQKNKHMGYAKNIPYVAKYEGLRKCSSYQKTPNVFNNIGVSVTGNIVLRKGDTALLEAASSHVVSVAIWVGNKFMTYKSGVYEDQNCNRGANHAVTVAGYGKLGNNKYWLVRNSWGNGWGDKGYIKMDRNKQNMCMISSYAHYPKVECMSGRTCKKVDPNKADGDGSDDESDDGSDDGDDGKPLPGCWKVTLGTKGKQKTWEKSKIPC